MFAGGLAGKKVGGIVHQGSLTLAANGLQHPEPILAITNCLDYICQAMFILNPSLPQPPENIGSRWIIEQAQIIRGVFDDDNVPEEEMSDEDFLRVFGKAGVTCLGLVQ